jgi:UDP-N-acetylglucosamine 2-epimerase
MTRRLTVLTIFGTRPEAIKLAPVIRELDRHPGRVRSVVCVTAQHRQMLDQALELFAIRPEHDLNLMRDRQDLTMLTAQVLTAVAPVLAEVRPDWVLVQGDTTTTLAASLAAFYAQAPVAHVEAGLRTHDRRAPFPEEINRRCTACLASLHFAPTETARQALLAEGVPPEAIEVTGNTVIDALAWARERVRDCPPALPPGLAQATAGKRIVLVTGHRRESFGEGFEQICLALRDLAERHPDVCVVYPVHLNPRVQDSVYPILRGVEGIVLLDPLPYSAFVWLMDRCHLILTDSGGIQEEAPALRKPVLVMRAATDRPESIAAGNARLVGVSRAAISGAAEQLLADDDAYRRMASAPNPYGDGQAAQRIVAALLERARPEDTLPAA